MVAPDFVFCIGLVQGRAGSLTAKTPHLVHTEARLFSWECAILVCSNIREAISYRSSLESLLEYYHPYETTSASICPVAGCLGR